MLFKIWTKYFIYFNKLNQNKRKSFTELKGMILTGLIFSAV